MTGVYFSNVPSILGNLGGNEWHSRIIASFLWRVGIYYLMIYVRLNIVHVNKKYKSSESSEMIVNKIQMKFFLENMQNSTLTRQ